VEILVGTWIPGFSNDNSRPSVRLVFLPSFAVLFGGSMGRMPEKWFVERRIFLECPSSPDMDGGVIAIDVVDLPSASRLHIMGQ
jgi:hypothetical protein